MLQDVVLKTLGREFKDHKRANLGSDTTDCLQVIGAGLPRCGTTSLKAALETLGFDPCHHMIDCVDSPSRSRLFTDVLRTRESDPPYTDSARLGSIRRAMRGYRATVDAPTCELYRELMTIYPSAKVVLNVRDSAGVWWKSFSDTLAVQLEWPFHILTFPVPFLREQNRMATTIVRRRRDEGVYGPQWYTRHAEEVKKHVPEERLLEFNVKEGWGPLCKFLKVPVPDKPFPHLNDTNDIKKAVRGAQIYGACVWLLYFGLAAAAGWLALRPPLFLQNLVEAYRPF